MLAMNPYFKKYVILKKMKTYTHTLSLQISCVTKFMYKSFWVNSKIYWKKIMEFRFTWKSVSLEEKVLLTVRKELNLTVMRQKTMQ